MANADKTPPSGDAPDTNAAPSAASENSFVKNPGLADFAFASRTDLPDATFAYTLAAASSAKTRALDLSDPLQRTLGNYQLISKLGEGGMGVVFRAHEPKLNRNVALKLLAAGSWATPEFIERFRTEAQSAARLFHPNIVPIFEIDQADDLVFFTMALVEGQTLAARQKRRMVDVRDAANIVLTLALAIDYAHQLNVLHLDLKPANVLVDLAGKLFIADFGLARSIEQSLGPQQTDHSGTVLVNLFRTLR
jgi:serine/threonine protein kinase